MNQHPADDLPMQLRLAIADDTPIEALTRLSTNRERCENRWIFFAVLKNPKTPPAVLMRLAKDENLRVLPYG
jgi:hypothetical protein